MDQGTDAAPEINSTWRHTSGALYKVAVITNEASTRPEYPPTVVYVSANDVWWSRPVADWRRSMTPADNYRPSVAAAGDDDA